MNKCNSLRNEKAIASKYVIKIRVWAFQIMQRSWTLWTCLMCMALQKHVFLSESVLWVYYVKSDILF